VDEVAAGVMKVVIDGAVRITEEAEVEEVEMEVEAVVGKQTASTVVAPVATAETRRAGLVIPRWPRMPGSSAGTLASSTTRRVG
jgi:hypothetical protein